MYNLHHFPTFLLVIFLLVAFFYLYVIIANRKTIISFFVPTPASLPSLKVNNIIGEAFPSQLIDKPIDLTQEHATVNLEDDPFEDPHLELVNDAGTLLLKEAEKIVEQIQETVNHIASNPPNPEEVFSKIRAIVSRFRIFEDTEYYDAINSFVAITVERDCSIQLSQDEIRALWN